MSRVRRMIVDEAIAGRLPDAALRDQYLLRLAEYNAAHDRFVRAREDGLRADRARRLEETHTRSDDGRFQRIADA